MAVNDNPTGLDPISVIQVSIQNMIGELSRTNDQLEKQNDKIEKTNDKVDKLTEVVSGQAILFEKLTNIELSMRQEFKHIHARVNEDHAETVKIKDMMAGGTCPTAKFINDHIMAYEASNDKDKDKIREDLKSIKTTLDDLKLKPAKRWDLMMTTVITGIISTIVAFFAIKLGLKG